MLFPNIEERMTQNKPTKSYGNSKPRKDDESLNQEGKITTQRHTKDADVLVHELETLQIELETQNKDLRLAHGEIEESRTKYADFYDFTPVGYLTFSGKGLISELNLTAAALLGFDRSRLVAKPFTLFISAGYQDTFHHHLRKVLQSEEKQACELVLKKKDGTLFHAQLESLPVKANGQRVVRTILTDISERKQTEETLRKNEQLLKKTLDSLLDAVFVTDATTMQILRCNKTASAMFGYTPDEMIGRCPDFLHVDQEALEDFRNHLYRAIEREGFLHLRDFRMRRKDGTIFPTEHTVMPLNDENGNRVGWVSTVRDLTDFQEAVQSLCESEFKYRTLFNSVNDAIYLCEAPGDSGLPGRFVAANEMACTRLGYTLEELLSMTPLDVDASEELDHASIRQSLLKHGHATFEAIQLAKDGTRIPVELNTRLTSFNDKQTVIVVARDITEHKRAEEALRKSEEKYHNIFENSMEGIFQSIPGGRLIDVNPAAAHMYGYETPEEMLALVTNIGRQLYVTYEDRVMYKDLLHKHGSVRGFEAQFYKKDGMVIWCTLSGRVVKDTTGRTLYYEGTVVDITSQKRAEEELKKTMETLRKTLGGTIRAMSLAVEARDPYTAGHQRRVSSLARAIGQEMGLAKDAIDNIRMAGIIHDIGKISVPADILSKPAGLSDIEMSLVHAHAQSGYDILKESELPYPIAEIVLQHHERLDGSGYPQGLKNGEIFLEAQIVAVADVVEAVASHRPYRPGHGIDVALMEIETNKSILYDPEVVETCLKLFREKEFRFE